MKGVIFKTVYLISSAFVPIGIYIINPGWGADHGFLGIAVFVGYGSFLFVFVSICESITIKKQEK